MAGVNKAILVGNLGRKPKSEYTPSGSCKCTFSIATSEKYTKKDGEKVENTQWHNIVLWSKLAEIAAKYLDKSSKVYVEGRIETRSWDDKDGNKKYITEIIGSSMQMIGSFDRPKDNPGQPDEPYNESRF